MRIDSLQRKVLADENYRDSRPGTHPIATPGDAGIQQTLLGLQVQHLVRTRSQLAEGSQQVPSVL